MLRSLLSSSARRGAARRLRRGGGAGGGGVEARGGGGVEARGAVGRASAPRPSAVSRALAMYDRGGVPSKVLFAFALFGGAYYLDYVFRLQDQAAELARLEREKEEEGGDPLEGLVSHRAPPR